MASVEELDSDFAFDIEGLVVGDADEAAHAFLSVLFGIDGFDGWFALFLAFFIEGVDVGHLDAACVGEHDGAEVARGGGAEDGATEAFFIDIGYEAGVVDVSVGKNEVVDFGGVESEVAVHSIGFEAFALVHAAVEQYFQSFFCCNEVLAAGYFFGCTHEFQFHDYVLY